MNANKRLCRSDEPVIAGVCGGIAEFFELDPTLIRILAVILVLVSFGFSAFVYIIAMVVMPKRSEDYPAYIDVKASPAQTHTGTGASGAVASAVANAVANAATNVTSTTGAEEGASAGAASRGMSAGAAGMGAAPGMAGAVGMGDTGTSAPGIGSASAGAPAGAPAPAPAGAAFAAASGCGYTAAAPGCGYTASNPQAYDADDPAASLGCDPRRPHRIRTGVMLGILLVSVGLLAFLDTLLDVSAWSFWPLIIIVIGFMTLCTPRKEGWSLVRAGHALCIITIGVVLQFWTLEIVTTGAFALTLYYLWPMLLVGLGLSIIGNATDQGFFNLLGSLLLSSALLFGVWNFGHVGETFLFLPSFSLPEEHLPWGGFWPFS